MKWLLKNINRLPAFLRNKYFICLLAFGIWMIFFDDNNLIQQVRLSSELHDMQDKMEYYRKETARVEKEKKELFSSARNLERYARENYWMKREDEDLFIITEVPKP